MRARWLAAAALAGVLAGAAGLRLVEALTTDAALERQKAELTRLSADLRDREAAVAAGQSLLAQQTDRLRQSAAQAAALADQALAAQGTAAERLKRVISAVRSLRDELAALPSP